MKEGKAVGRATRAADTEEEKKNDKRRTKGARRRRCFCCRAHLAAAALRDGPATGRVRLIIPYRVSGLFSYVSPRHNENYVVSGLPLEARTLALGGFQFFLSFPWPSKA